MSEQVQLRLRRSLPWLALCAAVAVCAWLAGFPFDLVLTAALTGFVIFALRVTSRVFRSELFESLGFFGALLVYAACLDAHQKRPEATWIFIGFPAVVILVMLVLAVFYPTTHQQPSPGNQTGNQEVPKSAPIRSWEEALPVIESRYHETLRFAICNLTPTLVIGRFLKPGEMRPTNPEPDADFTRIFGAYACVVSMQAASTASYVSSEVWKRFGDALCTSIYGRCVCAPEEELPYFFSLSHNRVDLMKVAETNFLRRLDPDGGEYAKFQLGPLRLILVEVELMMWEAVAEAFGDAANLSILRKQRLEKLNNRLELEKALGSVGYTTR